MTHRATPEHRLDDRRLDAYLDRIGAGRPARADEPDPAGSFRITPTDDGDLEVTLDDAPQYRLETRPRRLRDFEPTCWWHQTSPTSHFTRTLVRSLLNDDGRITLKDQTLIETTQTGQHEHTLPGDAEVLDTYRTCFGIVLDHLPSPRTPSSQPG